MWICPNCREEIADGLDNCWNCGADKSGSVITDADREIRRSMGRKELNVDMRQGEFFCVISGILGGIFFFIYQPAPPLMVKEIINHIKAASEANTGINEMVSGLTKEPYCYIISGVLLFGLIGRIVDRIIGNGNSKLCKISHFLSSSAIDKPIAKQIILKGLSREMVEDRLGFPLQIVTRENKELWMYKFIKITFENGKVALVE